MVAFISALIGNCGGDQIYLAFSDAVSVAQVNEADAKQFLQKLRQVANSVSVYPKGFMPEL